MRVKYYKAKSVGLIYKYEPKTTKWYVHMADGWFYLYQKTINPAESFHLIPLTKKDLFLELL